MSQYHSVLSSTVPPHRVLARSTDHILSQNFISYLFLVFSHLALSNFPLPFCILFTVCSFVPLCIVDLSTVDTRLLGQGIPSTYLQVFTLDKLVMLFGNA